MMLFGRLKDAVLGYLTPSDTARDQGWLHRAQHTPVAPSHNSNGKRPRSPASHHDADKRLKTLDGSAAYLTPPSFEITSSDYDMEELNSSTAKDSESTRGLRDVNTGEWSYINDALAVDESTWSATDSKESLALLSSPASKKRSPKNESSMQPDKQFDEADLKRFDIEKARAQREEDAKNMREAGWAEDPINVYVKIAMRGWGALFPKTWRLSFDSLPSILFADKPKDEYIKALSENQFRAMKAFRSLLTVPSRARDTTLKEVNTPPSRQPQELIRREISRYLKWAFADADVSDVTPTVAVLSAAEDVDPEVFEGKIIKRLTSLKQEWRENLAIGEGTDEDESIVVVNQLCAPPTIFAIVVNKLEFGFFALEDEDDERERPEIRNFYMHDMGKFHYDVWNTVAIAILVMHCRAKMANLKEIMDDYDKELAESAIPQGPRPTFL